MVNIVNVPELIPLTDAKVAAVQLALPDWRADDNSPVRYAIGQRAADEIAEKELLNASGRALIVATATGDDLDQRLADFDLTRRAGESDAAFRARAPTAFRQLGGDTTSYVDRLALSVPGVADAAWIRGAGYNNTVYIQATGFTDSNPGNPRPAADSALQTAVQAALNAPDAKPWKSDFDVVNEIRTDYTVDGTILYQAPATEAEIRAALVASELRQRRLGQRIVASEYISAALAVMGVNDAQITLNAGAAALPAVGTDTVNSTVYVGALGALVFTVGTIR